MSQQVVNRTLGEIDLDLDYARSDINIARDAMESAKAQHDKAIAEFDQFYDERVAAVKALVASGEMDKPRQWALLQQEPSRYRFLIETIGKEAGAANPALSMNTPGNALVIDLPTYITQPSHLPLCEALTRLMDDYDMSAVPDSRTKAIHEDGVRIALFHPSYRERLEVRWLAEEDVATLYVEASGKKVGYGGLGDILDAAIDHYTDRKRLA